ncbi:hypothetical protein D3C77_629700 [compost metagenome]
MTPRNWSMALRTTSMPTPRPDRLDTCSAVEKPASKISRWMSCSLIGESLSSMPRAMAFSRIFAVFRPRPSSWISSTIMPESW